MPVRVFTEGEREALRQKMLEAGFPLLRQYGMTHMSVAKITDAAGIGTSTFYNFWKNKEEYVAALADFQEEKIIRGILTEKMQDGSEAPGREEVRKFLKALVDDTVSIIPFLTPEDESGIFHRTDAFAPDVKKESRKTRSLLSGVRGVRRDMNPAVVANLVKVLALTAESRAELHASAYEETIDSLVENILREIF